MAQSDERDIAYRKAVEEISAEKVAALTPVLKASLMKLEAAQEKLSKAEEAASVARTAVSEIKKELSDLRKGIEELVAPEPPAAV